MRERNTVRLVSVRGNPDASGILYDLLSERPKYAWISHSVMPGRAEHAAFVENHPFRHWYLIEVPIIDAETHRVGGYAYVGAIECTDRNEIGVHILKRHQHKGYGSAALRLFLEQHEPLPPIKAVRNGSWLANIAPENREAMLFFSALGFRPIQETWAL